MQPRGGTDTMGSRKTGPEDREVGRDLARRRRAVGVSQELVAEALGISHQQYGKYERGENRLPVTRHRAVLAFFDARSTPGLSEGSQSRYVEEISRATAQRSINRIRRLLDDIQHALALLQRYVDRA